MTNIHEFTSSIIKLNPQAIIIEDLNVNGMRKNKYLSEKINEAKFYEIRRQLTYKCEWNNIELIIADRWYPSSKICSFCGHKKDKLSLSERTYVCEKCGCIIDRDYNASLNLKYLAS
jgi:putative transposase